eukprot:scaffold61567_cov14-Prasinocladus_malaysianus.AAC.1
MIAGGHKLRAHILCYVPARLDFPTLQRERKQNEGIRIVDSNKDIAGSDRMQSDTFRIVLARLNFPSL